MSWQDVRAQYPHQWVLIEAIDAYTKDGARIISEIHVLDSFGDAWHIAWVHYKAVHHAQPQHELYIVHTSRDVLDIRVLDQFRRTISEP